jgi:hypothetical protein
MPTQSSDFPSLLYRFSSVERAESLLAKGRAFYPSPTDFNDPFDCKFRFTDSSRDLRRRLSGELVQERGVNLSRRERRSMAASGASSSSYRRAEERLRQRIARRVGILSFSSKVKNLIMWSHYAVSHSGVCFEFDSAGLKGKALKVNYSSEYPTLDFLKAATQAREDAPEEAYRRVAETLYLTKSLDWTYEDEWRIIDPRHGRGFQSFPAEHLTAVILGCRISASDADRVKGWMRDGPMNPRLRQAQANSRSYSLEIRDL